MLPRDSSTHVSTPSAVIATGLAAVARRNFWLAASAEAKFIRASIAPVENQDCPRSHPATSGGSKSACPILLSGASVSPRENPVQPTSLSVRTTNSTGHEYRE